MTETTSHPNVTDSLAYLDAELSLVRQLLNSPGIALALDPNSRQWVFPFEGENLVILGTNEAALAGVVRAMHVGRTRRTGRRGHRRWHIEPLPVEQMPRRAAAVKPSRRRGN